MTQKEKRLLTIDLCTRLPYSPKAKCIRLTHVGNINNVSIPLKDLQSIEITGYEVSCNIVTFETEYGFGSTEIQDIRPYLRPMSSMIEEEFHNSPIYGNDVTHSYKIDKDGFHFIRIETYDNEVLDFLNAHHFDYRNLIEKGLALEAPEGMYKTE